jgi:hypothetical protein
LPPVFTDSVMHKKARQQLVEAMKPWMQPDRQTASFLFTTFERFPTLSFSPVRVTEYYTTVCTLHRNRNEFCFIYIGICNLVCLLYFL